MNTGSPSGGNQAEQSAASGPPITSSFAADPEMVELIEFFVAEMPERVRALSQFWDHKDLESLKRTAHQLKGSGGGYGFDVLSEAASRLEQATGKLFSSPPTSDLESVQRAVDELVGICQRVTVR